MNTDNIKDIIVKGYNSSDKTYKLQLDFEKDEDERNYIVSYDKISKIGFKPEITLEDGINELIEISKILHIENKYSNV